MVELREEEGEDEGDGGKITTRIRKVRFCFLSALW